MNKNRKRLVSESKKASRRMFKMTESMTAQQLAKEIESAVDWLKNTDEGCSTIKLDYYPLAVCVGWQDGYDVEEDDGLIHSKSDPSWVIVAGIKVWTSDSMRTDFDWINSPYEENGEVIDNDVTLEAANPGGEATWLMVAYEELVEYLENNHLKIEDDGKIVPEEEEEDDWYGESLKGKRNMREAFNFRNEHPDIWNMIEKYAKMVGSDCRPVQEDTYKISIDCAGHSEYEVSWLASRLREHGLSADIWEHYVEIFLYDMEESLKKSKRKVSENKERGKGMRTLKESYDDYNYYEAVKEDIESALEEDYYKEILENATDRDEAYEKLYDELWVEDSVTGNGSGSYTFNTYKAEEYICHNLDLMCDAIEEFGGNYKHCLESAETADVTIRCYLLGQVLGEVLDEYDFGEEE